MTTPWSERLIARELALNYFQRRNLVVVPNCSWPGSECDLLVLTANLRIIDVEIKISRADLRADSKKDKWYYGITGPRKTLPVQWPRKVWKHYYALPQDIWSDELLLAISPASGILLLAQREGGQVRVNEVLRAEKPCRDAEKISAESAIDIARLASLRMWDAYAKLEFARC